MRQRELFCLFARYADALYDHKTKPYGPEYNAEEVNVAFLEAYIPYPKGAYERKEGDKQRCG